MDLLLKTVAVILLCPLSFAVNSVFIAQTSQGGNTGLDCADAKAVTYFNTAGNWSATPTGIQIGPDTTVNVCATGGNITTDLTFQGSGTSGHPIILDGTAATMAAVIHTYSSSGWSWFTIQNFTWSTSFASAFAAIDIDGSSNFTIQSNHIDIANETTPDGNGARMLWMGQDNTGVLVTNALVQNNFFRNAATTSPNQIDIFDSDAGQNITVQGNYFETRVQDDPSCAASQNCHNDQIQTFAKGGGNAGQPANWTIRNNEFVMNCTSCANNRSWFIIQGLGAGFFNVYGNQFLGLQGASQANGISANADATGVALNIVGNTFVSKSGANNNVLAPNQSAGGTVLIADNIVYVTNTSAYSPSGTITRTTNLWFNSGTGNIPSCTGTSDICGQDPLFTNISTNNYSLQSASPARGAGSNLGTTYNRALCTGASWPNPLLCTRPTSGGWDIGAFQLGTLPPGLSLSSSGLLSGTPTTSGTYTFNVKVTDSLGQTATMPYSITVVNPSVVITSPAPPSGLLNSPYSFQFTATGGVPPCCTWSQTSASIPGLTLSTAGLLSGTPTTSGTFSYSVKATDSASNIATATYSITISASQIQLPQSAVNPHEFDSDLAAPAVTEHILSNGTGNHPYTCAGIQAALQDWAADTDKSYLILIDPGIIPATGGNCINLPAKANATHFVILQSSSPPNRNQTLCAGGLGTPSSGSVRNLGCATGTDQSHLWQISSTSSPGSVVSDNGNVTSGQGPNHIVIRDMAAFPATTVTTFNSILQICQGSATTIASLCSHIHIQYSYVHGDAGDTFTVGSPPGNNIIANGATFNCNNCSMMWNYFDKITRPANGGGAEGHQVAILENVGPFRITNNWMEGASSSIFCGGGGAHPIAGIVSCTNGEIRVNHFTYPLAWVGANWSSPPNNQAAIRKNGYESKEAQFMLLDGNEIDTVDQTGGQGAPCMDLTVRNTSGGPVGDNYTATIRDYTISNNIFHGCLGFQNDPKSGGSGNGGGVVTGGARVRYYNNVAYDMNSSTWCVGGQANTGGPGSCNPVGLPRVGTEHVTFTCAASRSATTGNITLTCNDHGTGFHQTNIAVGDRVGVTSCADASFNTNFGSLGPSGQVNGPPALAGTNGLLTVVYNNGSTGAATQVTRIGSASPGTVAGTGYQVGDVLTVIQSGASGGTITVAAVSSGVPTSYTVTTGGSGYNNGTALATTGGHGTGATVNINDAGCTIDTGFGWWNGWQWQHNTVVASTGQPNNTGAPYVVIGCPPNTALKTSQAQSMFVQDNIFAVSGYSGFTGGGATEGSSGANPAESCWDQSTFTYQYNVVAERSGANYTAFPSGLKGNVAGSHLYFPITVPCSTTTPNANCIGFSGMLSGTFNQTPSSITQLELCGGAGNPAGCAGPSVFASGQSQDASDGTDMGANIPQILAHQALNTYDCGGCGTIFYPSIGTVGFMDPSGNDSNPGTQTSPVLTLNKLRQVINGTAGSLGVIDPGFYPSSTTTFTSTDSGTLASPITYRGSGVANISGGVKVTGWANCDGVTHCKNIPTLTCTGCQTPVFVTLASASFQNFEQLWYNGTRRFRPRSPYTNPTTGVGTWYNQSSPGSGLRAICATTTSAFFPIQGICPATSGNNFQCFACYSRGTGDTQTTFHGLSGSCTAPGTCTGVQDVEVVASENWTNARMRLVPSFSDGTNTCTLSSTKLCTTGLTSAGASGGICSQPCPFGPSAGHNYFLDNVVEQLNQPQQWYLDRCPSSPTCASGVEATWELIYIPATGETPSSATIVIPQQATIISATSLANVNFSGLTFSNDNFVVPAAGQPGQTDAFGVAGALSMTNVQNINFSGDTWQGMGRIGVLFKGSSNNNSVTNSVLSDLGVLGIGIGALESSTDTTANTPHNNLISNVWIQGSQRFIINEGGCINVGNSGSNTLLNVTCNDVYNVGIGVGGSNGFNGTGHITAASNLLQYILCYNVAQGVTSDIGCLHAHTGKATGNTLQHFIFHDITQEPTNNSFFVGYNGEGVYLDQSSSNWTVNSGLVYRASESTVLVNSPDNLTVGNNFTNNIFAYGRQGLWKKSTDTPGLMFSSQNNIFYWDKGNPNLGWQFTHNSVTPGPQWGCQSGNCTSFFFFDSNTYWNPVSSGCNSQAFYTTNAGGTATYIPLATWQLSPILEDVHSLCSNPNFIGPSFGQGDNYNFAGTAPAGFIPWNFNQAGAQNLTPPAAVPIAYPLSLLNPATDF